MSLRRTIKGRDGPLEIDEARRTVTKTYLHLEHEIAVRKVEREVAHASRLFNALSHVDGLSCARIVEWDLSAPPRIVMALCAGELLSNLLRRSDRHDPRYAEIARKVHDGLEIYLRLFAEPYYDLCFQNLLYDEAAGVLTFLDFGIPNRVEEHGPGSPLEVSLGNLVGWACYDMARPANLFAPKSGYLDVLRAVLTTFDGRVSRKQVHVLACATFTRLADAGSAARRQYYRTVGAAVVTSSLKRLESGSAGTDCGVSG